MHATGLRPLSLSAGNRHYENLGRVSLFASVHDVSQSCSYARARQYPRIKNLKVTILPECEYRVEFAVTELKVRTLYRHRSRMLMNQFPAGQGHEPPNSEYNAHAEPRIELRVDVHGKHVSLGGKPFTIERASSGCLIHAQPIRRASSHNEESQSLIGYFLMSLIAIDSVG